MHNTGQHSALPLILITACGVITLSALGWFLSADPQNTAASAGRDDLQQVADSPARRSLQGRDLAIDVASELRKARLAADAGMLVGPPTQSALYFYGRILGSNPDHIDASREVDEILAQLSLRVSQHLAAGEFSAAHNVATIVGELRPAHPLIALTDSALNNRATSLISAARRNARLGNDGQASAVLAEAAALPGIDAQIVARGRRSVAAEQRARRASEEQLAAVEQTANELEWETQVRGAIKSGRLLTPGEGNAADLLAKADAAPEAKDKLAGELYDALLAAGLQSTALGDIATAEAYIAAATGLRADTSGLDELRRELDRIVIAEEESRILGLKDLIAISTPPARYPRLAERRNTTGWVDVLFTVTTSGETANIEIVQAEPASLFNRSAIEAVASWTFEPREFRGQLINQRAAVRLTYELN